MLYNYKHIQYGHGVTVERQCCRQQWCGEC